MSNRPFQCGWACARALEALALGLAYGAGLCCASACLVASFRPTGLSAPYWKDMPGLRTDTCGIAALLAGAVGFTTSEYLRLRRRQDGLRARRRPTRATGLVVWAISETAAIVATGVVVYVSVNSVTHPATLSMPTSHLAAWPTEGTARVIALLLCACSIAVLRYLYIGHIGPAPGRGVRAVDLSRLTRDSHDHASRNEAVCDRRQANGPGRKDTGPAVSAREGGSVPVIPW